MMRNAAISSIAAGLYVMRTIARSPHRNPIMEILP
jgi:hypothetical protein